MILTHGANSLKRGGDIDNIGGRVYRTVTIGGVTWLAENLDFKFSGLAIGPSGDPETLAAWYYNNDEATYGIDGTRKCGLLYNWHAVKHLNDNRSTLCPGWHVPTSAEWDALATAVGGYRTAGTKLKALDNSVTPGFPSSWGGTDDYYFGVLPGGDYYNDNFYSVGFRGSFWSESESSSSRAYYKFFDIYDSMNSDTNVKSHGNSLRLVKDA